MSKVEIDPHLVGRACRLIPTAGFDSDESKCYLTEKETIHDQS